MLNRSLLTPIYPASLSDCLIQTGPLSDAPLTRILFPRRLCSGRVTGVPLPKAHPTPPDQRRRHAAHRLRCPRLYASVEGSGAKRPVAKGGPITPCEGRCRRYQHAISFGSEAYFSFSAMVRYRSRLGSVFAAHFLNSGSSPPWRSFSSPRRPGRRTQRIKARLLFIAQRTVEFRERGLHGLHRAKRGVEPLLHRLDPTRGGQRLVG
jgi:hypothetical protein